MALYKSTVLWVFMRNLLEIVKSYQNTQWSMFNLSFVIFPAPGLAVPSVGRVIYKFVFDPCTRPSLKVINFFTNTTSDWEEMFQIHCDRFRKQKIILIVRLTHWSRVTHTCVDKFTNIGSGVWFAAWSAPSHLSEPMPEYCWLDP